MKISCPVCEKTNITQLAGVDKEITIRNKPIRFPMDLRKCNTCGEEFIIPGIDKDPMEQAYSLYREERGLLSPKEIKTFRKRYHLTQGELAGLIKLGGATLSRYENGQLQDETHDKLLRLAMDCDNLKKMVINSKGVFTDDKKVKVLKAIDENTGQMIDCLRSFITINLEDSEPDEYRGFKRFNVTKFLNMILYYCIKGETKTKLNKLLFYADFLHFKDYTLSISGSQYAHIPFGPAPNNYDLHYHILVSQETVKVEEMMYPNYSGEKYIANKGPDLAIFSEGELRILASVKERYSSYNALRISRESHKEKGYLETETGDLISYIYAAAINK